MRFCAAVPCSDFSSTYFSNPENIPNYTRGDFASIFSFQFTRTCACGCQPAKSLIKIHVQSTENKNTISAIVSNAMSD